MSRMSDFPSEQLLEINKINNHTGRGYENWGSEDGMARLILFRGNQVLVYLVDGEGNVLVQQADIGEWNYTEGVLYRVVYLAEVNGEMIETVSVSGFCTSAAANHHAAAFVGKQNMMVTCQVGAIIRAELSPYTPLVAANIETYSDLTGSTDPLLLEQFYAHV